MSALALHKVRAGSFGSHDACIQPACNRKGRYMVQIAGYPLPPESLAEHHAGRLCEKHGREWKRAWAELSGATELQEAEAAITALRGSKSERAEAIFALRDLGCSSEDVARALARAGNGHSVEQILEALAGDAQELGAVA